MPGAICCLGLKKEIDTPAPSWIRQGKAGDIVDHDENLAGRISIAHTALERVPTAVGLLGGGKGSRHPRLGVGLLARMAVELDGA